MKSNNFITSTAKLEAACASGEALTSMRREVIAHLPFTGVTGVTEDEMGEIWCA